MSVCLLSNSEILVLPSSVVVNIFVIMPPFLIFVTTTLFYGVGRFDKKVVVGGQGVPGSDTRFGVRRLCHLNQFG